MNYLMIIKKTYLTFLLIISIIFFFQGNLLSLENKILFKINNKSFTSFDLEKRKNYLEFIGDNNLLEYEIVFNDFFSSHIFRCQTFLIVCQCNLNLIFGYFL